MYHSAGACVSPEGGADKHRQDNKMEFQDDDKPLTENEGLRQWLSGFFDAEGSVGVSISENRELNIGVSAKPTARITQSYVAGFMDGDGSISLDVSEQKSYSLGHQARPNVNIWQKSNPAIRAICVYLDELGVQYNVHEMESQGAVQVSMQSTRSVETFLSSIKDNLISKHRQAEIMLDEILPLMSNGSHTNKHGFLRIMEMKDRLDENKGGNRGKYTLAHFEEKWGMNLNDQTGLGDFN